jgi:hypothetical protein
MFGADRVTYRPPAQLVDDRGEHPVGAHRVPVVVEPPHHDPVVVEQGALGAVHGAVREPVDLVEVAVERRLVRHDQVRAELDGALDHGVGREEGRHHTGHLGLGVSRLDRVDGLGNQRYACRCEDGVDEGTSGGHEPIMARR